VHYVNGQGQPANPDAPVLPSSVPIPTPTNTATSQATSSHAGPSTVYTPIGVPDDESSSKNSDTTKSSTLPFHIRVVPCMKKNPPIEDAKHHSQLS
jgi:hypothetical protein